MAKPKYPLARLSLAKDELMAITISGEAVVACNYLLASTAPYCGIRH